jgi:hypothetical protein
MIDTKLAIRVLVAAAAVVVLSLTLWFTSAASTWVHLP